MNCLKATFEYRCIPSFVKDKTEAGPIQIETEDDIETFDETVYREFQAPDIKNCAISDDKV